MLNKQRYKVLGLLGKGSNGQVYKCRIIKG